MAGSEHLQDSRRAFTHRVTYWTGIWEPRREAISKEVAWLRQELASGSPIVAFTPQRTAWLTRERVLRINQHRWAWLRAAALAVEWAGDLTHVFGPIDAAHYLSILGRRPILFTVAIPGLPLARALYARVQRFVAESRGLADALVHAGVSADRVEVIYPAVNLEAYAPQPPPADGPFRLLFASTPSDPEEIESRGIGLLIELARSRPDIEVVLLWRQWGRASEARRALESRQPPRNCRVEQRDVVDMASVYRDVHATVCCFEAGTGKSAPNSVIEGLASGRPALLADTCGISDLVKEWQAGVVTARTVEDLARGVDELRQGYASAQIQARRLAEEEFDSLRALKRYADLYRGLANAR